MKKRFFNVNITLVCPLGIYSALSALFALHFKVYTRAQWSVGFSAARKIL